MLNRDHLAFEIGQLGGHRPVTANEERCWPEDNDRDTSRNLIIGALLVLRTCDLRCPRRYALSLQAKLLASVVRIRDGRNVSWRDLG